MTQGAEPSERPLTRRSAIALGAGGVALMAGALAIALANEHGDLRGVAGVLNAMTIGSLVAVGLYAWRRQPENRFGRLVVLAGYGWFAVALGASDSSLLYSIGRVAAWPQEAFVVYLFLIFPAGTLVGRFPRAVMGLIALVVAALYLPTALLVDQYPTPGSFSLCTSGCPDNAFMLTAVEPGVIEALIKPLREVLTGICFLAVTVILVRRVIDASRPMRRTLTPVLAAALFSTLLMVVLLIARGTDALSDLALEFAVAVRGFAIPVAALGFFTGLVSWRLYEGRALKRLALESARLESTAELEDLLARTLDDPSLKIRYRLRGEWRDSNGNPVPAPVETTERCVVQVHDSSGVPLAAIDCDCALAGQRGLLDACGAWIRNAVERRRLDAALAASLHDVEASRRRLATAAAGERRRIERDLHDGAQQQLVTLRVRLELAGEELKSDPEVGARRLLELGPSVDAVIEEVRALAGGIYPALLADAGLAEALRSVAARNLIPVEVDLADGSRFAIEVESAVYFCCLEALQNASKHSGAETISIVVRREGDDLVFFVSDDGIGFDVGPGRNGSLEARGAGLTNMNDRLAAVGGSVEIDSAPGRGTRVRGRVPVAADARVGVPS